MLLFFLLFKCSLKKIAMTLLPEQSEGEKRRKKSKSKKVPKFWLNERTQTKQIRLLSGKRDRRPRASRGHSDQSWISAALWQCNGVCARACAWGSARGTHLGLDLLGRVREEDGGVGVAGAHFGLGPLQGREEGRVQQGWFGVPDPGGYVPRHPEVRVLWGEIFEDGGKKCASF